MFSFVLPTWNRAERLAATLEALGELGAGDREVIIVDNCSDRTPIVPAQLANGWRVELIRLDENRGAAARNIGVEAASGEWVIMLDDDSHPRDDGYANVIAEAPPEVFAIGADIHLPSGGREAGGLPEVFIGCGVAVRRDAFLAVGGYDESFHYYVEEYDLAAKMLLAGGRVVHDARFRVLHEKTDANRDMNVIVQRLVRNNGWVAARYAPPEVKTGEFDEVLEQYKRIAQRENAMAGYDRGVAELNATLSEQPARVMPTELFDRFTGLRCARSALQQAAFQGRVAVIEEGKNQWAVRQAIDEAGLEVVEDVEHADALVIGTLSPGPVMDAWDQRSKWGKPVVRCWEPEGERVKEAISHEPLAIRHEAGERG